MVFEEIMTIPPEIWDALKILSIIVIGIIVDRIIVSRAKMIAKKLRVPIEVIKSIITFFRFILLAVILVMLATVQFLPTEYFVGAGALIGTAIGLGASRYISNYVSGAYILFSGLYKIGDYVRIGSDEGIVTDMTVNYTKVKKEDGTILVLSNRGVLDKSVINFKVEENGKEYIVYPIRVSFDLKLTWGKIKAILDDTCNEFKEEVIDIRYEVINVTRLEVVSDIIIKVDEPEKIPPLKSRILQRVLEKISSSSA